MRFGVYCAGSAAVCGLMLAEALLVYPNLFSALVGLSDSVVKVCALINLACCLTILWTKMVLYIFLGGARANEMQTVYNKGWMFLCNSILYWGVRNLRSHITAYDLGVCMLSIFVLIALHWISNERVKVAFYETEPVSYFNIARLGLLCFILGGIDIALCYKAVTGFLKGKYSLSLFSLFLLDLLEMSVIFMGHYIIYFYEMIYLSKNEDEDEWDRKVFFQTIVNLSSCVLGIVAHCVILHVFNLNTSDTITFGVRFVNLYNDGKELRRLLKNSSEVDKFSVPADLADLERDNTCVICRDEMTVENRGHPKKSAQRLQCGHVMHATCLKSWMARSDKCPTCRQSVHSAASAFPAQQAIEARAEDVAEPAPIFYEAPQGPVPVVEENVPQAVLTHARARETANEDDADEDVSDLLSSPAHQTPPRTVASGTANPRSPFDVNVISSEHQRYDSREPTPGPTTVSYVVERETPFSGRIVSSSNVAQAYTFREIYLL